MYDASSALQLRPLAARPRSDGEWLLDDVVRLGRLKPSRAGRMELLHRGDDHLDRTIDAIRTARERVELEIYQVGPDAVGRRLCGALARAAARGVEVRVLADSWGSAAAAGLLQWLGSRGVEVRWYNPLRPWRSPLRHTHRKLLIVDRRWASIGGMNYTAAFSARHSGPQAWRDVVLWLKGPVVSVLARQLDRAWAAWGGIPVPETPGEAVDRGGVAVAVAGGADGRDGHAAAYHALLRSARHEALMATPYFIPDRPLRQELVAAAQRGVRVVIVLPRLNDLTWFKHAARSFYAGLLGAGIEIWERCDRMVHAKVAVIDGAVAAIGSANLNHQSLANNAETLLLTAEPGIVGDIHGLISREAAADAERLCPLAWRTHPDRDRLAELLASPMSLVL